MDLGRPGTTTADMIQVARLALDVGLEDEALTLLQDVLAIAPEFPPAHALLADYYDKRGEVKAARYHFGKIRP
jgi:Tfp pilus assembly protein PilF